MNGTEGRHARSTSFSMPPEETAEYSEAQGQMTQTTRRRRMERYEQPVPPPQIPVQQAQIQFRPVQQAQQPTANQQVPQTHSTAHMQPEYPYQEQTAHQFRQQYPSQPMPRTGYQEQYTGNTNGPGYTSIQKQQASGHHGGRPIRDWQRQIPNPPMTIRRDLTEDGVDPQLKETRSPHVYDRKGRFWGDDNGIDEPVNLDGDFVTTTEELPKKEKVKPGIRPLYLTGMFILGVVLIWFILRFTLFRVAQINVTGTTHYTAEYVAQLSGIRIGDDMMALNQEKIRDGINSEVHLKFDYLEKKIPGEILIAVKEREPAAFLNYCGITYVTDKSGMVLDENEDPAYRPAGLIEVKGLRIRTGFTPGQNLPLISEEQGEVFKSLFLEIRVIGCSEMIREVDLSDTGEVYLLTADDISVAMGNNTDFHAKLRSMMIVREEIISRGYNGGTINVRDPAHPAYVPPAL